MHRQAVDSTNLAGVGYDAETETLEVEFHHGGVYEYFGVPPSIHQGLLEAPSLGSYFNKHVRHSYEQRRVS